MDTNGKVWGITSTILDQNNVQVALIQCEKGGYCSIHKHEHKYNAFHILTGALLIEIWKDGLVDATVLQAGQKCTVRPGEQHRFTVLEEGTTALEFYWTQLVDSDIVRRTQGAMNKNFSHLTKSAHAKAVGFLDGKTGQENIITQSPGTRRRGRNDRLRP